MESPKRLRMGKLLESDPKGDHSPSRHTSRDRSPLNSSRRTPRAEKGRGEGPKRNLSDSTFEGLVQDVEKDRGKDSEEFSRRNALVPGFDKILVLGAGQDRKEISQEPPHEEGSKEISRRNALVPGLDTIIVLGVEQEQGEGSKEVSRSREGSKEPSRRHILVSQEEVELAIKNVREFLIAKLGTKAEVFKALDSNGNGDVSYTELSANLKDLNCPVDDLCGRVTLKRVFSELDIDGRNALSVKELMTANPWQVEEEAVSLLRQALAAQFPTKPELLAAFDEDKTGSISFGELEKSLRLYGISVEEATGGCDLGRLFDFLDSDCSGELTMYELFESDPREAAKERDAAILKFREAILERWGSKQDAMRALDTNSNGKLSYQELQGGLQRNHISMREICGNKDFKWFFRVLDVDGSGQLSSKELIDLDPAREVARLAASRRKRARRSMIQKSASVPVQRKVDRDVDGDVDVDGHGHGDVVDKYEALLSKFKALEDDLFEHRKVHTKLHQEHIKIKEENKRLSDDRKKFQNDLEEKYKAPQEEELRIENELLKNELKLLKEDHALLTRKHNKLRVGLNEDWHMLTSGGTLEDAAKLDTITLDGPSEIRFSNKDVPAKSTGAQQDMGAAEEQALLTLREPIAWVDKRVGNASRDIRAKQDLPSCSIEKPVSSVRRRRPLAWGEKPGAHFIERPTSSVRLRNQLDSLRGQLSYVSERAGSLVTAKGWPHRVSDDLD